MIIRKAKSTDLKSLIELLRILFALEKDFSFHACRQHRGLEMMLENDRGIMLVAERDTQVIGMCSGQLMISTAEGGFSLLVEDVVVDERWRGRGVGKKLLQALEDWAGKRDTVRFQLLADQSNKAGLKFYHNQSWQNTELICLCKRPMVINKREG